LQDIFGRMQPAVRLFLIGAALPWAGLAQRAGDIPPALVREKLKGDCPANLDWSSLHGNVVVVGFPSEFVTPDDIKEWNKLPEKFQGEPVVFIQVAGGSEFLVDQALNKTPYQGCVLFDSQQANRRNFGLPDFSRTVVVDGQGWIAGYTRGDISEPTVRSVITHHGTADLVEADCARLRDRGRAQSVPTPARDRRREPDDRKQSAIDDWDGPNNARDCPKV
jgi:hypothetical protein